MYVLEYGKGSELQVTFDLELEEKVRFPAHEAGQALQGKGNRIRGGAETGRREYYTSRNKTSQGTELETWGRAAGEGAEMALYSLRKSLIFFFQQGMRSVKCF